ncbi:hypothetical protein [Streptomyces sp. Je 1-332]
MTAVRPRVGGRRTVLVSQALGLGVRRVGRPLHLDEFFEGACLSSRW